MAPPVAKILSRIQDIFKKIHNGRTKVEDTAAVEAATISQYLSQGRLFVDVPIDLQGLPCPVNPTYIWQLTNRPVDEAFNGLSPLADRLGSCVSRFLCILQKLDKRFLTNSEFLGKKLFETYPAASLENINLNSVKYKGGEGAQYNGSAWRGISNKDKQKDKDKKLAKLLNDLDWKASPYTKLNDDEFDAALCAVIGVLPENEYWLQGVELNNTINNKLNSGIFVGPKGYVILKKQPENITIVRVAN